MRDRMNQNILVDGLDQPDTPSITMLARELMIGRDEHDLHRRDDERQMIPQLQSVHHRQVNVDERARGRRVEPPDEEFLR